MRTACHAQWSQPGEAAAERVWLTERELSLLPARGDRLQPHRLIQAVGALAAVRCIRC